jgi:hypothetical protein
VDGRDAGRLGDDGVPAVEVGGERRGRDAQEVAVTVTVQGDGVAARRDLGRERRLTLDLLADQEERRARARSVQGGEDRGRALRMRAVVERQRDLVRAAGQAARDAERRAQ